MQNEQQLRFVNGKFMRGATEVQPVIGDPEQIAAKRIYDERRPRLEEMARKGRLRVWTRITHVEAADGEPVGFIPSLELDCICGYTASNFDEALGLIEHGSSADTDEIRCRECGRRYKIPGRGGFARLIQDEAPSASRGGELFDGSGDVIGNIEGRELKL